MDCRNNKQPKNEHQIHRENTHSDKKIVVSKKIILWFLAITLFVVGLIYLARDEARRDSQAQGDVSSSGALSASETLFDFGEISMADGNVSRVFKVKNNTSNATVVKRLYTSCMCTSAKLKHANKELGPYGMPGHGFIPDVNESIGAGEEAEVEVTFDPNAHGPAGIGKIERAVTLEQANGDRLALTIRATVKP